VDRLKIQGPAKLSGSVRVSSAKNASLPIMFATLLSAKKIQLRHLPLLRDVRTTVKLLNELGVVTEEKAESTFFDASHIHNFSAPYDLVKTMRASILVLGPLLGRFQKAKVSLPGGCAIGARPIDIHLEGLKKMGAEIEIQNGYVEAKTKGLKGTLIPLRFPSVGATENLMMAAVLAKGETIIENAAREPEIVDLAKFLNAMGADISGAGESSIFINGVDELTGCDYEVMGDRIEAMTYIMAGFITNSKIRIENCPYQTFVVVKNLLEQMNGHLKIIDSTTVETQIHQGLKACSLETAPYPGFPTDAQAQILALATQAEGVSIITEKIFENRFMHVPELQRMGAEIELKGNSAIVRGKNILSGAPVMCTDLRASAALVLAALAAKGETDIARVYHLDRGYEYLDQKLAKLGLNISRYNPDI
jgi:UDP-N-acetylglucosamine 1-carboxyvinyltransferase